MKISVVLPTYNRGHVIGRSIQSVLDQTIPVSEIIVVDDGSTDNTEEVVRSFDDDRIQFIRTPENKGAAAARNLGVKNARYEMIAFHDSDDEWRRDKMEKQISYINDHPGCRFVYCAFIKHFEYSDLIIPDMNDGTKLEGDILAQLLYQNTISTQTILMERSLLNEIGGFDESLKSQIDWDMVIRVAKVCPIGFVPEVLVDLASSPDSITSNRGNYYQSRCLFLKKYMNDYLSTNTFDKTIESILIMAEEDNVLEQVKKLMLTYMSA